MWSFRDDHSFWIENEKVVTEYLEILWYNIVRSDDATSIHDWKITNEWKSVHVELKTRRCSSLDYPDTMIGENKLEKAREIFEEKWEHTLFFFSYTDWLYYIDAINNPPDRYEVRKGRYDRWGFDKPKAWVFYKIENLKKVY